LAEIRPIGYGLVVHGRILASSDSWIA